MSYSLFIVGASAASTTARPPPIPTTAKVLSLDEIEKQMAQ